MFVKVKPLSQTHQNPFVRNGSNRLQSQIFYCKGNTKMIHLMSENPFLSFIAHNRINVRKYLPRQREFDAGHLSYTTSRLLIYSITDGTFLYRLNFTRELENSKIVNTHQIMHVEVCI